MSRLMTRDEMLLIGATHCQLPELALEMVLHLVPDLPRAEIVLVHIAACEKTRRLSEACVEVRASEAFAPDVHPFVLRAVVDLLHAHLARCGIPAYYENLQVLVGA